MKINHKKAIIVCSEDANILYSENTFYIGVERGCLALIKSSIKIDLAISDFDSVNLGELELIKKHAEKFIKEIPEKDYIDGELAIFETIKLGITNVEIYLPINDRIDMIFSSVYFANKYNVIVHMGSNLILPLKKRVPKVLEYDKYKNYKYLSIIPIKKSSIILNNLKYSRKKPYKINAFSSNGISNELLPNKKAIIKVLKGECALLLIKH